MDPKCVFCQIVNGSAPAHIVYQDDLATAFKDIHPHTPVHILIIPNSHIDSVNDIDGSNAALVGHLFLVAQKLAAENNISGSGYRLLVNTGPDAGQSVQHLHLHLLGGQKMPLKLG